MVEAISLLANKNKGLFFLVLLDVLGIDCTSLSQRDNGLMSDNTIPAELEIILHVSSTSGHSSSMRASGSLLSLLIYNCPSLFNLGVFQILQVLFGLSNSFHWDLSISRSLVFEFSIVSLFTLVCFSVRGLPELVSRDLLFDFSIFTLSIRYSVQPGDLGVSVDFAVIMIEGGCINRRASLGGKDQ